MKEWSARRMKSPNHQGAMLLSEWCQLLSMKQMFQNKKEALKDVVRLNFHVKSRQCATAFVITTDGKMWDSLDSEFVKTAFPVIVLGANGYAFFQGN
jgi:hypothetical protein